MYVDVKWDENPYTSRGGYWYVKIMYEDERDRHYKGGWQADLCVYKWTAQLAAKRILRKAKRAENKKVHRGWKVY